MQTTTIKKNSLFVDTSGWLCTMGRDQPYHREAAMLYQTSMTTHGVITTNYIIVELIALAEKKLRASRGDLLAAIDAIITNPKVQIIHIDTQSHLEAWNLLKARPDKEWSLVDATSFVVMRQIGMTEALTTDHHFTQAGFVRLPVPE